MAHWFICQDVEYLVDVHEIVDADCSPEGSEVFAAAPEDGSGKRRHYYFYLLRLSKEDGPTPIWISDESEPLRGQLLQKIGEHATKLHTFIANPYFDELMIFWGAQVVTSKDRHAPVTCTQCGRANLFERRDKENKSAYIQKIQAELSLNPNREWPFKENLFLQFSVSDRQKRLDEIDLDNLAKTIFDSLQGLVYVNDAQITRLLSDKESVANMVALVVAIKRLEPGERPKSQEFLFSGRLDEWQEERDEKARLGKSTHFETYNFRFEAE